MQVHDVHPAPIFYHLCNGQGSVKLEYLTQSRKARQVFPLRLCAFAWVFFLEMTNKEADVELTPFKPAIYRISVVGTLNSNWSDYFHAATIATESASDQKMVTTLTANVMDQADLVGVINALYGLGLPFLSIEYVESA